MSAHFLQAAVVLAWEPLPQLNLWINIQVKARLNNTEINIGGGFESDDDFAIERKKASANLQKKLCLRFQLSRIAGSAQGMKTLSSF